VARLGLAGRWHLGFQSRVGPLAWLRPPTDDLIRDLARAGARALLVVPVSFVSDHLETLHEIDIQYRDLARRSGITEFRRAATLGDGPAFVAALAGLVARHLADLGAAAPERGTR
jgi:protoporphyrin/coproporphyrin ferrochelatase